MFLLNKLKSADLYFFIAIGAIILVCLLIYFLIPVFKRKQYEEQRQNLKKREATFRANLKKLNSDKKRSLMIGLSIISIEFLMNISYFSQTMGGDLGGMMISAVAALVVTAILIAETYMLSQTKYDIWTLEELISKIDKD